jgi:hypothetical protein
VPAPGVVVQGPITVRVTVQGGITFSSFRDITIIDSSEV